MFFAIIVTTFFLKVTKDVYEPLVLKTYTVTHKVLPFYVAKNKYRN